MVKIRNEFLDFQQISADSDVAKPICVPINIFNSKTCKQDTKT